MYKRLFAFFLLNRFLIVILGLFALTLASTTRSSLMRGDSPSFSIYQGDSTYVYTQPTSRWLNMWAVWDTKWYISIADDGYSTQRYPFEKVDNKGFLPLYAILIYIFGNGLFFGNLFLAGIVISNFFLILSLIMLYKLIHQEEKIRERILSKTDIFFYALTFPTAYILSAIYPESLFLFLSIAVFYAVKIHKIALAIVLFGLACMTKTFGLFLIIPIALHILKERKHISLIRLLGYILLSLVIPVTYCLYMYSISGDPFAYIHIQEKFFSHSWTEPISQIFSSSFFGNFSQTWNGWFSLIPLFVILLASKKLPLSYTLYGLAVILFTPSTGMVLGASRYMASLFVFPVALSVLIQKPETKYIVISVFSVLQGFALFWWIVGTGFVS